MAACRKCNGTGRFGGGTCYSCNGTGVYGSTNSSWSTPLPRSTYNKGGGTKKQNIKDYDGSTYGDHKWYNPSTHQSGWAGGEYNHNAKGGTGKRKGYHWEKNVWGERIVVDNATGQAYDSVERWKSMTQ